MSQHPISIVMPAYNEGEHIFTNVSRVRGILAASGLDCDFVLVDDGSSDDTWQEMCRLSREIPGLTAIAFSRNFGKEAALCAGLAHATGDACVIMDADLQHPPSLIPEMVRLWRDEGYDVVEGVKSHRGQESAVSGFAARLFYRVFAQLSGVDLGQASDFKLLDRRVVEAWRSMGESSTFFRGMSAWLGYRRYQLPFEVEERSGGQSKWSLRLLFKLAIDAALAFTSMPLHLITVIGLVFDVIGFVLILQTVYMKFVGHAVTGFTTVILLELVIGGLILSSLGVIGAYIARIFNEVKRRPRYIVAQTTGGARVVR